MNIKFKKQDGLLLAVIMTYSYLFYEQHPGINVLIFNLIVIGALVISRPIKAVSPALWVTALGCLLSSVGVVVVNTDLAVFASFLSLILLLGYVLDKESSLFVSLLNATYSMLAAPFVYSVRYFHRRPDETSARPSLSQRLRLLRFGSLALPVLIALIFLSLYASANPVFSSLLEQIRFDFISWEWVRFTLIGTFILFGFFYTTQMESLTQWDDKQINDIVRTRRTKTQDFHPLALKFELKTGVILLLLLNLLLLVFNLADISYISGSRLPEGLTYSQYVHQGVYTLIVSIILAILIIVYFLRGNLNFHSRNRLLILLTYAWIVQNIILALGIAYKNGLYIEEYSLTYKRIGVFVYLFLALAGLLTTYTKTGSLKNHWYLLRRNAWIAYVLLLVMSLFNWDRIITNTNLKKTDNTDFKYLTGLSDANLPELQLLENDNRLPLTLTADLTHKRQAFFERTRSTGWQSWNYRDHKITYQLNDLLP